MVNAYHSVCKVGRCTSAKWEDIYLLSLFLCAILSISSQSDQFLTAVQTLVPSSKGSISVEMLTAICCPGAGLLGSEKVRAFLLEPSLCYI